jgi:hypothetical protein
MKRKLVFLRDDKTAELQFEIGRLLSDITLAKDLLEDLQLAVTCKPMSYINLICEFEKQMEEIYERARLLIHTFKKEVISNDC